MTEVMDVFERTGADHLPVLDKEGHLRGYVSRQHLYTQYRKIVADNSRD
jgi:CIC family chloride channel protein